MGRPLMDRGHRAPAVVRRIGSLTFSRSHDAGGPLRQTSINGETEILNIEAVVKAWKVWLFHFSRSHCANNSAVEWLALISKPHLDSAPVN